MSFDHKRVLFSPSIFFSKHNPHHACCYIQLRSLCSPVREVRPFYPKLIHIGNLGLD